jgi:hypothetical protein
MFRTTIGLSNACFLIPIVVVYVQLMKSPSVPQSIITLMLVVDSLSVTSFMGHNILNFLVSHVTVW